MVLIVNRRDFALLLGGGCSPHASYRTRAVSEHGIRSTGFTFKLWGSGICSAGIIASPVMPS